jgi:hypothetical protein
MAELAETQPETTEVQALTETGEIPLYAPDGRPLTRKERRELERSLRPMETWTAEEEMIATGQIPAMTPEVIADQERAADHHSGRVSAEAQAASAELAMVSMTDKPQPLAGTSPQRESVFARAEDPAEEPSTPVEWGSASEHTLSPQQDPEPAPQVEPVVVPEPTSPAGSSLPPEVAAEFQALFPPASVQSRPAVQEFVPPAIPDNPGAVDEIRRLTAEAMAGIDRAVATPVPAEAVPAFDEVSLAAESPMWPEPEPLEPRPTTGGVQTTPHFTPSAPHHLTFDAALAGGLAASSGPEVGGLSPWESHPLDAVESRTMELPDYGVTQDIPRPDFSSIFQPTNTGSFAPVEPVPTGQIEVPRRERPEVPASHPARDLRWANLAVLGAVAFVLAIVVWHLAGFGE